MKGSSVQPETPQVQNDELPARYEKLKTLWGEDALRAIVNAHVLVLGIGGVGSNCTEALARGGVGKLMILDRDVVEESNINRQSIAFYSTLGKRKVDVMEAMIKDINPEAQVKKVFGFLRQEEMESFLMSMRAMWTMWSMRSIRSRRSSNWLNLRRTTRSS